MVRKWSFHSVALASGASAQEAATHRELVKLFENDSERASWHRSCSYRVVRRSHVAAVATAWQSEADENSDTQQDEEHEENYAVTTTVPDIHRGAKTALTPQQLAISFQRLVHLDKQDFATFLTTDDSKMAQIPVPNSTDNGELRSDTEMEPQVRSSPQGEAEDLASLPARIYLLVDFPTTLDEAEALLQLGEIDADINLRASVHEALPLLPLIDGVVLLVDPLQERGNRRKNVAADPKTHRSNVNTTNKIDNPVTSESSTLAEVDPVSPFLTANKSIKVFYEASRVSGLLWSDFEFTDIACVRADASDEAITHQEPIEDLAREMVKSIERLAIEKFAFKDWVQSTTVYPIPSLAGSETAKLLMAKYCDLLQTASPASVSVSTVVFALREAVATLDECDDDSYNDCAAGESPSSCRLEDFIEFHDAAGLRAVRSIACQEALRTAGDSQVVANESIADIERLMWCQSDLPGIGNRGRKGFPVAPMLSTVERGVFDTEFDAFCPSELDPAHVHLTRQLLQLEDLLGPVWKGKLQTREWAEQLSTRVFPQRLGQVLQQSPTTHILYYEPTDAAILACINSTPSGRFHTTVWSADEHVRHRPAFRNWRKERLVASEYLTPRTEAAAHACVPLSTAELEGVAERAWSFYPEDRSIIRLYQTARDIWLSVYQDSNVFGFRPIVLENCVPSNMSTHAVQFVASFGDDTRLHVCESKRLFPKKPDGFSGITVSNTFPCGLVISTSSDGSTVQRFIRPSTHFSELSSDDEEDSSMREWPEESEEYRVIYGKGSVLRVFADESRQILSPDGSVYMINKSQNGSPRVIDAEACATPSTFIVDPETNTVVERRTSGVMIATHTDGARITYHADGTRMFTNAAGTHVLVHKDGLADVTMDMNVNIVAERHAFGERVAVTKGGLRTRTVVNVYDGTSIEVAYNTKVTAQVNGRVTTTKPDGTVIVVKDSGRVEYSSAQSLGLCSGSPLPQLSEEDKDRDVISHNGVYYFDCRLGRFELCDNEQNTFLIEIGDRSTAPRASVDLAGEVSVAESEKYQVDRIPAAATINDPIQPHVFILNGDGTALEIMRPREVSEFLDANKGDKGSFGISNPQNPVGFLENRLFWRPCTLNKRMPIFNNANLEIELAHLRKPVATVGKYLQDYYAEFSSRSNRQQFTVVRRLLALQPLSAPFVEKMQEAWQAWRRWQEERSANKDRFKVVDPRDHDALAREAAMQKRVLATYKAARARKKLERQKAREQRLADAANKGALMESVPEGNESANAEDAGPAGESHSGDLDEDDDFDQYGSETSNDGSCDGAANDVDDPMALLWTAFSHTDTTGSGLLSLPQARQAIIQAIGTGVTSSELATVLQQRFRLTQPFAVSFDLFVDLVEHFKRCYGDGDGDSTHAAGSGSVPPLHASSALRIGQRQHIAPPPAGSAAEAVRRR